MARNKLLLPNDEWTIPELKNAWDKISSIAKKELELDFYDTQIHIVTYEQMLALYASHFLPITYPHWSFGKMYSIHKEHYKSGKENLPYEVIINTDPTLMYLSENNTSTLQLLTMSHAGCGHGTVFKSNFLFKEHTDPNFILSYMAYASNFIRECESKYGPEHVEMLLDACHSLQYHGVFKYPRKHLKKSEKEKQLKYRKQVAEENYNTTNDKSDFRIIKKNKELIKILQGLGEDARNQNKINKYDLPQENLLYFIEKHSLSLELWEKEVVRIVRKISQYFYPQIQTKLVHEGYASFVHYELMTLLYNKKMISDGQYVEFLHNHTNVLNQGDGVSPVINPYKLGFEIFSNIKKVCLEPTKDDYYWFPEIAGTKDWKKATRFAMENFIDESFVLQYLSKEVVEKLQMFSVQDDSTKNYVLISNIQSDEDFRSLRKQIALQYSIAHHIPQIEITNFNPYYHAVELARNFQGKMLDEEDDIRTTKNFKVLMGCDKITVVDYRRFLEEDD